MADVSHSTSERFSDDTTSGLVEDQDVYVESRACDWNVYYDFQPQNYHYLVTV